MTVFRGNLTFLTSQNWAFLELFFQNALKYRPFVRFGSNHLQMIRNIPNFNRKKESSYYIFPLLSNSNWKYGCLFANFFRKFSQIVFHAWDFHDSTYTTTALRNLHRRASKALQGENGRETAKKINNAVNWQKCTSTYIWYLS